MTDKEFDDKMNGTVMIIATPFMLVGLVVSIPLIGFLCGIFGTFKILTGYGARV